MRLVTGLETLVNRAVYSANLLERAVHEPNGWTISWGPHNVPAERHVGDDGVTFVADIEEACYLAPVASNVVLRQGGDIVAVRAMDHPGDTGFSVSWRLAITVGEWAGVA